MNAARLNWTLVAVYVVLAGAYACERNWPKCLYFLGAVAITMAIGLMD